MRLARPEARVPPDFQGPLDQTANKARRENLASKDFPVRQERMESMAGWVQMAPKEKKESRDLRVLQEFEVALDHQDPKEMLDLLVFPEPKVNQANKARRAFQERMEVTARKEPQDLPGKLVPLGPWGCLEQMANQVPRVQQVSRGPRVCQGRKVTEVSLVRLVPSAQQDHRGCLDLRGYLVSAGHLVLPET